MYTILKEVEDVMFRAIDQLSEKSNELQLVQSHTIPLCHDCESYLDKLSENYC